MYPTPLNGAESKYSVENAEKILPVCENVQWNSSVKINISDHLHLNQNFSKSAKNLDFDSYVLWKPLYQAF